MDINKLHFHTFGPNDNSYFISLVQQYKNIKPNNIHFEYDDNINDNLKKHLNDETVVFIIGNNVTIDRIPCYPIIIFEKKTIIISSIVLQQIGGIPIAENIEKCFDLMYGNIEKYLGGIIVDNLTFITKTKHLLYDNYFADNKFEKNISVVKIQYKNSTSYFDNCSHGWLAGSTKYNLKFVIDKIKPKNIVELGSWYGLSASYMINITPKSNFYFFDKFQNICLSPYIIDKFNVLNKFYFTFPRMETFCKNIMDCNPSGNIYGCRMNALKSIDLLKKNDISIDLIFIDFLKKTHELFNFLNVCISNYPNAVIVGDDYVFDTVKYAIVKFSKLHGNKYNIYILPESYIISKIKLDGHDDKKIKKDKSENMYKKVKKLIENNEFDLALTIIKEHKLNMNDAVFGNNNTIYHILAKVLFQINKKDIIHEFEKYQKPEKIENMLLLTYDDYFNYNINFS